MACVEHANLNRLIWVLLQYSNQRHTSDCTITTRRFITALEWNEKLRKQHLVLIILEHVMDKTQESRALGKARGKETDMSDNTIKLYSI